MVEGSGSSWATQPHPKETTSEAVSMTVVLMTVVPCYESFKISVDIFDYLIVYGPW